MYNIVGAAMEVYNVLGRGMEEPIYQEALDMEMVERGMNSHREVWLDTFYKGIKLKKQYKADFVIDGVIVELKSVSAFDSEHRAHRRAGNATQSPRVAHRHAQKRPPSDFRQEGL